MILSGGRRTQVGLVGAIGFHLALWLFGWGVTVYSVLMLPTLVLLLRAERRAATVPTDGRRCRSCLQRGGNDPEALRDALR